MASDTLLTFLRHSPLLHNRTRSLSHPFPGRQRSPPAYTGPSTSRVIACANKYAPIRSDTVQYFAYFSNISPSRLGPLASLSSRRFDVLDVQLSTLNDYRLVFNVPGLPPEPAFANIESAKGHAVKGVLYTLGKSNFQRLALSEGCVLDNGIPSFLRGPASLISGARLHEVNVTLENGKTTRATTFWWKTRLLPPMAKRILKPSRRYVQCAIDGARYRGMDRKYIIQVLSKIDTHTGPLGAFGLFVDQRPHILDMVPDRKSDYFSPWAPIAMKEAISAFQKDGYTDHNHELRLLSLSSQMQEKNDGRLLYFVPGIDGSGRSILSHVQDLQDDGYSVWSVIYPHDNRQSLPELATSLAELLRKHAAGRQINIVAESMGATFTLLTVIHEAKRRQSAMQSNGDPRKNLNLGFLMLLNPATSFLQSPLAATWKSLLQANVPDEIYRMVLAPVLLPLAVDSSALGSPVSLEVLARAQKTLWSMGGFSDLLPRDMLRHRVDLLRSFSISSKDFSILRETAENIAVVCSENDNLLPSVREAARLRRQLPGLKIAVLPFGGHTILQDTRFCLSHFLRTLDDLSSVGVSPCGTLNANVSHIRREELKRRRNALRKRFRKDDGSNGRCLGHRVSPLDLKRLTDFLADARLLFSPVFVGEERLPNGPIDRPVIFVSNHTLLPVYDAMFIIERILVEKGILLRSLASRMIFLSDVQNGFISMPATKAFSVEEAFRFGMVPLSPRTFMAQLANNEWSLLFPGGARESLKRKSDKPYSLHWPESVEFVRSAALFGALIIPVATVGSEDMVEILLDGPQMRPIYDRLLRLFTSKSFEETIEVAAGGGAKAWKGKGTEEDVLAVAPPLGVPKGLDRLYYRFGEPIEVPLSAFDDAALANEVYVRVKSQVEHGVQVLLERRKHDAYRSSAARSAFALSHGIATAPPAAPAWPWSDGRSGVLGEDKQPPLR